MEENKTLTPEEMKEQHDFVVSSTIGELGPDPKWTPDWRSKKLKPEEMQQPGESIEAFALRMKIKIKNNQ